jgi:CDP-glucose 4,6-dehydratase
MAVRHAFDGFWRGRRVFVTGHNGFKGAWLALWLESLGAEVHGFALAAPAGVPNHHELLGLRHAQTIGDLRNPAALTAALQRFRPEIVFHLAAQPLARRAYLEPARTFETNVTGLVNLLDAIRVCPSVRALVSVTSHHGLDHRDGAFRGTMAAGTPGPDPYSASKACAELVVDSYRASFLSHDDGRGFPVDVATAHMSNVIGGGDWSDDRLVPELVRAAAGGAPARIRSPDAMRPWLHVLDAVCGYLLLGRHLLQKGTTATTGWRFDPGPLARWPVSRLVAALSHEWQDMRHEFVADTVLACLDAGGAPGADEGAPSDDEVARTLGWRTVWSPQRSVAATADWYRGFLRSGRIGSRQDLQRYVDDASAAGLGWAASG